MTNRYAAHRAFVRPALKSPNLGPVLVVAVLMELIFILTPTFVGTMLPDRWLILYETGATPLGVLAQLLTFGVIAAALLWLVRKFHNRGFWSMVGPIDATIRNLKLAGLAVFVLLAVQTVLPPWIVFADLVEIRPLTSWAVWIIPTIVVLIIQTGTEELYFRGYLQQQCAALSDKPWVWMGLPSLLFGAGHYLNGFGPADGVLYALWATLLGLACADLTARTGNIGAAIGLHLSNNLFAFMIVGEKGMPSSGLALFLYPATDHSQFDYGLNTLAQPWVIGEVIAITLMIGVMWLAARVALRR
ncbi:MAG: membrane protease YdiL (CAAX protease family) [Yoonia sp.]|jgi:membrane protease YdiL (CAAX protease family)